jgi:hypothetical protein
VPSSALVVEDQQQRNGLKKGLSKSNESFLDKVLRRPSLLFHRRDYGQDQTGKGLKR